MTSFKKKGRDYFKELEKLAKTIQRAIANFYRLGKLVQESIDVILGVLFGEIGALEKKPQIIG